jgi:hypothetical protein
MARAPSLGFQVVLYAYGALDSLKAADNGSDAQRHIITALAEGIAGPSKLELCGTPFSDECIDGIPGHRFLFFS